MKKLLLALLTHHVFLFFLSFVVDVYLVYVKGELDIVCLLQKIILSGTFVL